MINLQQLYNLGLADRIDIFNGITVPDDCEVLNASILKSVCFERCGLNIPIYPDPDTFAAAVTLWSRKNQYTFKHIDNIMVAKYSPIENVFEDKTTSRKFDGKTDTTGHTEGETGHTEGGSTGETLSNDTTTLQHGKKTDITHGKKTTESGTDTNNTTNTISAYDAQNYSPDTKSDNTITYGHTATDSGTDSTTDSGTDTTTRNYTKTNTRNLTSSGNSEQDTTGKEIKDDLEKITESRHGNIGVTSANKLQIEEYNMLAEFNPYTFLAELFETELTLCIY